VSYVCIYFPHEVKLPFIMLSAEQKGGIVFTHDRSSESRKSMWDRFSKLKEIKEKGKFPRNLFIIPDGNGRWADKFAGGVVQRGHEKGADVIVQAFADLAELSDHIPYVGAWGLSMDNLRRPPEEVDYLMNLFHRTIKRLQPDLKARGNKFIHIGRKDIFDNYPDVRRSIEETEEETEKNTGQVIYVAVGFSGEDQELRMMEKARQLSPEVKLTPEIVASFRDGGGLIPPADLIVRTSGEQRLSDIGWLAGKGTELYFLEKFFPSCGTGDIVKALVDFSQRDRRLGERPTTS